MAEPTPNQIAFLKSFGIEPASTKAACKTIIGFVIDGNGAGGGDNDYKRAAFFRKQQQEWNGKRARSRRTGITGTVRYLLAKTPQEVANRKEDMEQWPSKGRHLVHPFNAIFVEDEKTRGVLFSLGNLERLEEVQKEVTK